jgi:hypothetical protein
MLRMAYFTPMQYSNPAAELLAERLSRLVQGPINRFFFACDGSEPWSRPSSSPAITTSSGASGSVTRSIARRALTMA